MGPEVLIPLAIIGINLLFAVVGIALIVLVFKALYKYIKN